MKLQRNTVARLRALLAAGLVACCMPAGATPFTLNLHGVVTGLSFHPFDPLGGVVHAGSPMDLYLNFDSDAADAAAGPNLGSYTVSGGTYGVAAVLGPVVFPVLRTVNISVADGAGAGPDQYTIHAHEGVPGGLSDYFSLSVLLQDGSGTAISGDALPLAVPEFARFGVRSFGLSGQYTNVDGVFMQYEVQGLFMPVSSPGTLALLCAAATAIGGLLISAGPRARAHGLRAAAQRPGITSTPMPR